MSEQPTPADLTDEIVLAAAKAIQHEREHRWEGRVHQGDCIVDARAALEASRAAGFGPVRAVEAERDALLQQQPFRVAEANRVRAEQAEAREKALRESVETLAERYAAEGAARDAAGRPAWPNNVARDLRALLKGGAVK